MTIANTSILFAALSATCAVLLFLSSRTWPWPERFAAILAPFLFLLCVWESTLRIFFADRFIWNEIRLARTFGLYRSIPLYPGKDATGPILGTLHTPLSHILFWPATLAPNPLAAVRAGALLSVLLVFSALLYTFLQASSADTLGLRRIVRVAFALEIFWLLILHTNVLSCIFVIHADPIALACATLAGSLLYKSPLSSRRLLLAALFAVLSVAAKQTFLALPVALCIFLLIADGWKVFRTFCLWLLLWGVLIGSAILALFHPAKDLIFNLITLSSGRPPQPIVAALPHLHDGLRLASFKAYHAIGHSLHSGTEGRAFFAFFLLLCAWIAVLRRAHPADWPFSLRTLFSHHRWLLFVTIALVMFPLLFKASITVGGDQNHLSIADYFLALAVSLSFLGLRQPQPEPKSGAHAERAPHLFVFAILIFLLSRTGLEFKRILTVGQPLTAEAAAFSLAHPGVVYFASNPLGSVYAEHTFYTFDHSIEDREIVGYPVTPGQLQSGLPHHEQLIAIEPHTVVVNEVSNALTQYLNSGWTQTTVSELPDFVVYRRK